MVLCPMAKPHGTGKCSVTTAHALAVSFHRANDVFFYAANRITIIVALPIENIRVGQQYRQVSEQITHYLVELALTTPPISPVGRSRLENWTSEGDSIVDKFVKGFWLELRDMSRLTELGLDDDFSDKIFKPNSIQTFMDNIDELCKRMLYYIITSPSHFPLGHPS